MDKQERNRCYTYFGIAGNFDPNVISSILNLSPVEQRQIGDVHKSGIESKFASWKYGLCEEYDVLVENQMMKTIRDLIPKKNELKEIKKNYDVSFYLEIVPSIYVDEVSPSLSPNREVIEFCYETETDIDIDLYLFDSSDED